LATETANFIEENKDSSFFAYLSFYSVHTPLIGRPDLVEKYKIKKEQMSISDSIWGREGHRKLRRVQEHDVYAAMVEAMDLAVGKVLDKIAELELQNKTIIILMSDNGGLSTSEGHPTSNLPLRAGKGWLYEGGIREPMVIKWPGVTREGEIVNTPVISTDFYPTILEMAGIDPMPGQHMDGVSMVPLLRGNKPTEQRYLFWHYPHYGNQGGTPGAAVQSGDFKYIEFFEERPPELYNLRKDLGESVNLADSLPEIANELKVILHSWQKETDAQFPMKNESFDPSTPEYH
jgi:arylsulfatase A-like enzyme